MKEDLLYWLATLYLNDIGPVRARRCLEHFGTLQNVFNASTSELTQLQLTEVQIESLKNPNWRAAEKDLLWCQQNHCHILTINDTNYPKLLKEIYSPPLVLFVRGNLELLSKPQLAIVGSRNPTVTGRQQAEDFAYCLTQNGLTITSGLALGIDAAAHQGALKANQATIAVCGTGLQYTYPHTNRKLAEKILENGALISELTPDTRPQAKNFPLRNRLISGLSLGVLIVEAAIKSGSLITAQFAVDQGREVFALPGSIHNPLAKGCHQAIRHGAKLVENAGHIMEELGALKAVVAPSSQKTCNLDSKQAHVLKQIGYEITAFDAIIMRSGLTRGEVSSILISLELESYVSVAAGGYMRNR